mmetsp:Transcript_21739/g.37228  ORF Transcript_21739/g.37228 Transcript_21739/m.37228 type:complete len:405 (+) Transcript_21739:3-1217(+)
MISSKHHLQTHKKSGSSSAYSCTNTLLLLRGLVVQCPCASSMAATDGRAVAHAAFVCFLGASTILVSSGVIAFNKYLMHEDRFPFAVPLVMCHMCFSSIMSLGLYLTFPFLFPSRSDPEKKVPMDRNMLKGVLPIAFLFSMQLVGSNAAYLHSTVGFLQMMKESQLLFVYIFSVFLAVEVLTLRSCTLICWILAATTLTVQGELNFSFTGFALQGSCVVVESFRLVLQGLMLAPGGRKLDPLTYVMLVSPLCFGFLTGFLLFLNYVMPMQILATPSWHHIATWWPMLLANACLAFVLNVAIALFVKHSSPVAVILAGLLKDIAIVAAGGLLLRELISSLQIFGFVLQIFGIFLWSMLRTFPEQFENGILRGFIVIGDRLCNAPIGKKDLEDKGYGSIEAGQKSS